MAPRWLSIALLLAIAAAAAADDAPSLAQEEKTAAQAQEELLRLGPLASQTEDVLIMAGGKLQATKAKISDAQSRVETLRSEEASNAESIRKAQRTRADAALKVSDEQNTLRAATRLIDAARSEEQDEVKHRAASEENQGEGVATEHPAGVLLAESKALNRQSNTVLRQSHSTQAKALAALDLKMAQGLANKASAGMTAAKDLFASAISQRKQAVASEAAAAQDVIAAATKSEAENRDIIPLRRVQRGDVAGAAAEQTVIATDANAVDSAEGDFGRAKQALASGRSHGTALAEELLSVQQKVDGLRKEFTVAQGEVLAAAKTHVHATQQLKAVTAANLAAESRLGGLREEETDTLKKQLDDARKGQMHASSRYEQASTTMEGVRAHRTRLQVKVARLQVQLKQAELQRDSALRRESDEHRHQNQVETQLSKEDVQLHRYQTQLAERGLFKDGDGDAHRAKRGRTSEDLRDEQGVRAALAEEKRRQDSASDHREHAVLSAKSEADNVASAQAEVEKQMERVSQLEKTLSS